MRARDVVGKRIVSIHHIRWYNTQMNRHETDVDAIVLDDGSELRPFAYEGEGTVEATILLVRPKGESK